MNKQLAVLVGVLLLVGCVAPYRKFTGDYGYTDTAFGGGRHQVVYIGPAGMTLAEANHYATVRAAELSLARGYPYFQVTETRESMSHGRRLVPEQAAAAPPTTNAVPLEAIAYQQPVCILHIQLLAEPVPQSVVAEEILNRARREGIKLAPGMQFELQTGH